MIRKILLSLLVITCSFSINAQINITEEEELNLNYAEPKDYEIGGITIEGIQFLDNNALVTISGLSVGDKIRIPGDDISKAINKLWKQGLFEDIKIKYTKIVDNTIFLAIHLKERPRLSKFSFKGVRKGEADKLREEIHISRGDVITENMIFRATEKVKKYFIDKGYLNVETTIKRENDTTLNNSQILIFDIKKLSKVKINKIHIEGNKDLTAKKIKRTFKKTKEKKLYRIFSRSKFIPEEYKADKTKLIDKYNELGYRDMQITYDTVYANNSKTVDIKIKIEEGQKFYFRNISWVGNTKYTSEELTSVLGIKKGDVFNQKLLDERLNFTMEGRDITSLYQDDGYLFFNVTPIETNVVNDSIDYEFRIYEGKQARINKIIVNGNTKTNDDVVIREIRTKPGQLFSRGDLIRTQRELAQLRFFNPEKIGITPKPNPADGTVDIEYTVEETSSDQIELSGGWGGGYVIGTLGLSFNNFSLRNIFKKYAWQPLPAGDGQKLALRAQTYGKNYQTYSFSFTEPWLGGHNPNSFSISYYHSRIGNGLSGENKSLTVINGVSVGLGKRLTVPDDFFTIYYGLNYNNYIFNNSSYSSFGFQSGTSNNINLNIIFGRNSVDAPLYPRSGSDFSISGQFTPPYSIFNGKDYSKMSSSEKYKWFEYHKWKFSSSWYTKIVGDLVINTRIKFGYIGNYNSKTGEIPIERFFLGGSGLNTQSMFTSRDVIALRGYEDEKLTPIGYRSYELSNGATQRMLEPIGGTIFDKYTMEVRFPISLNPSATFYVLGFAEAGNNFENFKQFNAFDVKRSAGVGVRIFLPMFGLLGLDWGYGFDELPNYNGANKSQFHFSIGGSID